MSSLCGESKLTYPRLILAIVDINGLIIFSWIIPWCLGSSSCNFLRVIKMLPVFKIALLHFNSTAFVTNRDLFNSLAPGRFQRNFRKVIFQLMLVIDGWSISCKIVLKWMPMDLTDGKSTLVQVMAWCRQATSHYLSQCWPRSLSPYEVIRPQWVNQYQYQGRDK